jgi:chromosome segregation ATPase
MHRYYSPVAVEADQKTVIIRQLQSEIADLRRNEQDYYHLQDQLRQLEHRFAVLNDQKAADDHAFRGRHDIALRNIAQLKNEIDATKAELRDRNLELGDLDADGNTLKTQCDQRNIEIERLKNDANSLLADHDELLAERARLENQFNILKQEKGTLLNELGNLEADNDSVARKIADSEKYLGQLDAEGKAMHDDLVHLENENNRLDAELQARSNDLANLEKSIAEAQRAIKELQADLAEAAALNNKFKSEAAHFLRSAQQEAARNNDLLRNISTGENTLRNRENQIGDARAQLDGLFQENTDLAGLNERLAQDLESCRRHIDNLTAQNTQLVSELERFCAEDESVRVLIDRCPRVNWYRSRVADSVHLSRTTLNPGSRIGYSKII